MLHDRLDDDGAAASFAGTLLRPERVAARSPGWPAAPGRWSACRAGRAPRYACWTPSPGWRWPCSR
ncbi:MULTISPECIES: hypothetical protein [unclassified Micromonospora]|uniref:hypothetical protein n=1 Tax=unclassified Micromonospora TaxID=2617518 RepID=UPI001E3B3638|nr:MULTISPECIES: hypothetical protein [unclassified Micromonospora]